MKTNKVNQRHQAVFAYISKYWQEHACPPSIRDIQAGCGISPTSVVNYILENKSREYGVIYTRNGKSRNIVPLWVKEAISQRAV